MPVPVSMTHPCEVGDVVSRYGGFNTRLVLKVDPNGMPTEMLSMKGREIAIDADIERKDDGRLYHTDRTSTEEDWRRLAGYAHWKGNEAMRRRIWTDIHKD